jgi:hypothetical protein
MAFKSVSGSFTGTGQSASFQLPGNRGPAMLPILLNITLSGTFSATVVVERSFDDGSTWHPVAKNTDGDAASYTAPLSLSAAECETPMLYRLNCTSYSSGTVTYRISA